MVLFQNLCFYNCD